MEKWRQKPKEKPGNLPNFSGFGYGSVFHILKKPVTVRLRFFENQNLRFRLRFRLAKKAPVNRFFGYGSVNRSFPNL